MTVSNYIQCLSFNVWTKIAYTTYISADIISIVVLNINKRMYNAQSVLEANKIYVSKLYMYYPLIKMLMQSAL